jgi:prephenate dehydrogenase
MIDDQVHARNVMLDVLPEDSDILCTHPMFGPESGKFGWQGLPFLYEKVRISDNER